MPIMATLKAFLDCLSTLSEFRKHTACISTRLAALKQLLPRVVVVSRYTAVVRTVSASQLNLRCNFQKPEIATKSPTPADSLLIFSSFGISLHASKKQQLSSRNVCTVHSCNPNRSAIFESRSDVW